MPSETMRKNYHSQFSNAVLCLQGSNYNCAYSKYYPYFILHANHKSLQSK